MANSNFVVHNGLTVGQTTIWAGNSLLAVAGAATIAGDVTISGNITVTGTSTFTGQQVVAGQVDATLADATSLAIALG